MKQLIYRPIGRNDFARLDSLPAFEGFCWNHAITSLSEAMDIRERRNAAGHCYFNLLNFGEKDWRSDWFDFINRNVLPVMDEHFVPARFPWNNRKLIDWYSLGYTSTVVQFVDVMQSVGPGFGVWADHAWKRPYDWMFGPNGPPRSQCLPENADAIWRWGLSYCLREVSRRVPLLVNGDAYDFGKPFFEHAEYNLPKIMDLWQRTPGSICTVDANEAPGAVEELIEKWLDVGGWIGFTSRDNVGSPAVDAAYEEAARRRG